MMASSVKRDFKNRDGPNGKIEITLGVTDVTYMFSSSWSFHKTYRYGKEINRGAKGKIHRVYQQSGDKKTDKPLVVKETRCEDKYDLQEVQNTFGITHEARYNEEISIKHISLPVDPEAYCSLNPGEKPTEDVKLYVIYEEAICNLYQFIEAIGDYNHGDKGGVPRTVIRQVATGLDGVHKLGFVHRDLKPQNILIDRKRIIKITDFGVSAQNYNDEYQTQCGTTYYKSLEVMQMKVYNHKTDYFSMNRSVLTLLDINVEKNEIKKYNEGLEDRRVIYAKLDILEVYKAPNGHYYLAYFVNGRPRPYSKRHIDALTISINGIPSIGDLLTQGLRKDPEKRPEIPQYIQSCIVNGRPNKDQREFEELFEQHFGLESGCNNNISSDINNIANNNNSENNMDEDKEMEIDLIASRNRYNNSNNNYYNNISLAINNISNFNNSDNNMDEYKEMERNMIASRYRNSNSNNNYYNSQKRGRKRGNRMMEEDVPLGNVHYDIGPKSNQRRRLNSYKSRTWE